MLSKENRIPKTLYSTLLRKSRVFSIDETTIRFSSVEKNSIFSIIVSGKVSKKAVQRNLIKRVFYNKIKEKGVSSKIPQKALFIYVSKGFGGLSRTQINQKVEDILNKICLYFQKG